MGGTKTQYLEAPKQPPAPSASESARDIYQARLEYDPRIARQEFAIQQELMPQEAALETALMARYIPELAQLYTTVQQRQMPQLQALQKELFPQQAQIIEAGAGRALERLASPFGYTPEEQTALEEIRQGQRSELVRALRERANLGGGLFGGRAAAREEEALTELEQAFAAEDINRRLQGGLYAQQAAAPYINILYPQAATPQYTPERVPYTSVVPSPETLYNALYQAGRREYGIVPGQPSPLWQLAGTLGTGAMMAAAMSSLAYKEDIKENDIDSLKIIEELDIVNFRYKPEFNDDKKRIGLIAENTPDILTTRDKKAIDIVNVIGLLLDAVKKLSLKVKE